ncbi:MAG: rhodanese-like domain-containing protein [Polaribacter sp.]|nr:rhodanese-like domain-containing protein [Polaribacter sp.]
MLILFFSLSVFSSCRSQEKEIVKRVNVVTFTKGIALKNTQLVDVRTQEEFEQGHIKGAKLINFYSKNFKEELQQLDKTIPVYLYCRSGVRSRKASKLLKKLGFQEIYDLKGGYVAYKNK